MAVEKNNKLPKEVEEYLHLKFLGAAVCEMCGGERYAITTLKGASITVCELCFHEVVKEEIESTQEYIDQQKEYKEQLKRAKELDAIERTRYDGYKKK